MHKSGQFGSVISTLAHGLKGPRFDSQSRAFKVLKKEKEKKHKLFDLLNCSIILAKQSICLVGTIPICYGTSIKLKSVAIQKELCTDMGQSQNAMCNEKGKLKKNFLRDKNLKKTLKFQ